MTNFPKEPKPGKSAKAMTGSGVANKPNTPCALNSAAQSLPIAKLLTAKQVGEILGCSLRHVRRLIDTGQIPSHTMGKLVRISQDDLARFVKSTREIRHRDASQVTVNTE